MSPPVLGLFDCWRKQTSKCKSALDGIIEIQLFLTEDSPAVLDQLKALGLRVSKDRPKEKVLIGRLPVDKLVDLAKMERVKFITRVRR